MSGRFFEIGSSNLCCTLCDIGASIAGVRVRNAVGGFTEVALPVTSLQTGDSDPSLAGRTIGPCCGRVRGGEICIDGKQYRLTQNEGRNHLHGGNDGCATRDWLVEEASPFRIRFSLQLSDGLNGYPGNRTLFAEYKVEGNALRVTYTAITDQDTWLDLTNHVYWDLGGRYDGSAMEQCLEIAASKVVYNDAAHLPVAIMDMDEVMDFPSPCTLSEKLSGHPDHPQLSNAHGFNNAYLLDSARVRSMGCAARLYSPLSGIRMTMTTSQPAIVLYSGGYLDAATKLNAHPGVASPGCAVALEAQGLPDPFHLPGAQPALLSDDSTYRAEICWYFEA